MSLTLFILITILIVFAVAQSKEKKWQALWLGLLFLASLLMLHQYFTLKKENTTSYLLEHKGFQFQDTLVLANGRWPETAIWDKEAGLLQIVSEGGKCKLMAENYNTPIYIKSEQGYELFNKDGGIPFKNHLIFYLPDSGGTAKPSFKLELSTKELGKGRNNTLYIFSGLYADKINKDTSQFHTTLKYGYSLADILEKTPPFKGKQKWLSWAEESLLVREHVLENNGDAGCLYFFPSASLLKKTQLKISSDLGSARSFTYKQTLEIDNELAFFKGIHKRRNPIYQIKEKTNPLVDSLPKKHSLTYLLPNRLELKKQVSEQKQEYIIISSIDSTKNRYKYSFNLFSEPKNLHHIQASISYALGESKKNLEFKITDYQFDTKSNFRFYSPKRSQQFSLKTKQPKVDWKLEIVNRRNSSLLPSWQAYLFLTVLLLLILLLLNRFWNKTKPVRKLEAVTYVVLYAFLSVRVLGQWRMVTFYPIQQMDLATYQFFCGTIRIPIINLIVSEHFFWTVACSAFGFLLFFLNSFSKHEPKQIFQTDFRSKKNVFFLLSILLILLLPLPASERCLNIYFPVLAYFISSFTLLNNAEQGRISKYWVIAPMLCCLIWLAVADAGYAIIFLLYLIFHWLIFNILSRSNKTRKHYYIGFCGTIAFLICLLFEDKAIGGAVILIENLQSTWSAQGAVGFLLSFSAFSGLASFFYFRLGKRSRLRKILILSVNAILILLAFIQWQTRANPFNSLQEKILIIKHRAEILEQPIEKLILANQFNSKSVTEILQATHNQWLINFYRNRGKALSVEYKRQAGFIQGASHITQTTDLVIPRYFIYEHGSLPILLLVALAFLFFALTWRLSGARLPYTQQAIMGIPLLFFLSALFVWMTSTNRFTFFGQDFPILSLTSKFTLVFTFAQCFLLIFLSEPKLVATQSEKKKGVLETYIPLIVLVVICIFIYALHDKSNKLASQEHFNVSNLIDEITAPIDSVNIEFMEYQSENHIIIDSLNLSLADLLESFNELKQVGDQLVIGRATVTNRLKKYPFLASAYQSFLARTDKRNQNDLIHIQEDNGFYKLAINSHFFYITAPKEEK